MMSDPDSYSAWLLPWILILSVITTHDLGAEFFCWLTNRGMLWV